MEGTLPRKKPENSLIRVLLFDHTAMLGGGEIALLNLVRHLNPDTVKPIVVLGADGPLVERLRPDIETHVLPLAARVGKTKKDALGIATLFRVREIFDVLAYVVRLARFIRQHQVQLVHANSLKADILGGIAGRLSFCPVIWHVRDRIDDDYLPKPVVRMFRLLCRVIPSYVIANSAATFRTLGLRETPFTDFDPARGPGHHRFAVVHDGTYPRSSTPEAADQPMSRIGLIGRISPWKGQDVFLKAAARVTKTFPNVKFVIIGAALFSEHEFEQKVRRLPSELGIDGVVEFTGFRDDIERAIDELDVVVHASTTGEPFGQVIIEGMAAGKPVVATNGGGVPEIVEDGATGLLVPMGDVQAMAEAVCRLLRDPTRAREMGRRARERVKSHFTLELTAQRVEAVYREMLGKNIGRVTAPD
jgi:glycosyltransferase involved in cell wall biosynthesis